MLLSKFKLYYAYVLLVAVLTVGLSAQVSPAASDLPSNQQVIAFLTESVEWYRHRAIERQIATNPVDRAFLEDNRHIAAEIVQLSFDFARADTSIAAAAPAGNQKGSIETASGSSPELAQFIQLENNTELASRQASQQTEEIKKKLLTARGAERRKLQAALDATQSRLDLLQTGLASLREIVEFVRATGGRDTRDLESWPWLWAHQASDLHALQQQKASDWTSLATFFGLVTAGVAVALQSVILCAVGYFVLVGKRGIRLGDRVQISGVTGDVTDIGWLQFQVREIDPRTQQPTGNLVTFSNSFVLASPATGLSKFNREELKPAQLEVAAKASQP
jgi:Mechanosensitive ion channel, beta-domain